MTSRQIIKINNEEYYIDIDKCIKNGYMKPKETEYIDLGLPSGTLWASENVDDNYYTSDEAVEKFGKQLPTRTQFCELIDYTEHKWDNGKKGMWFIGKNGNKLFLPALGFKVSNKDHSIGSYGYYWSSTFSSDDYAWRLYFDSDRVGTDGYDRYYGFSVRLVKDNFK